MNGTCSQPEISAWRRLAATRTGAEGSGRWLRSWQADLNDGAGGARHLAYAADHGALIDGFISLYEATGELRWLGEAVSTADALLERVRSGLAEGTAY